MRTGDVELEHSLALQIIREAMLFVDYIATHNQIDDHNLPLIQAVVAYRKHNRQIPSLPCPKCKRPMQRRQHDPHKPHRAHQRYYFSEYDVCQPCGHIQFYERYKVWLNPEPLPQARLNSLPPKLSRITPPADTEYYNGELAPWDLPENN